MYKKEMRALFMFPFFATFAFAGEFRSAAKFQLAPNCILELEAMETNAPRKAPTEGIWGYSVLRNKLYMGTGGFAPRSILTKATLILDSKEIPLDVSGIGNPWTEKPYRTWVHWKNENELGVLMAAFSDGAEIYVVTWHVFLGSSLRIEMRYLGDEEIPWLKRRDPSRQ